MTWTVISVFFNIRNSKSSVIIYDVCAHNSTYSMLCSYSGEGALPFHILIRKEGIALGHGLLFFLPCMISKVILSLEPNAAILLHIEQKHIFFCPAI